MIRAVPTAEDEHVYAFTARGLAVIGAALGIVIATAILGAAALKHSDRAIRVAGQATTNRVLTSCYEANGRHFQAKAALEVLSSGVPRPRGQSSRQREGLIVGLTDAFAPAYLAGPRSLPRAERERLGCRARAIRLATQPPR